MARFASSLKRLGTRLQVIDGSAFRQIVPLIYGKTNALATLAWSLGGASPGIVMVDDAYLEQVSQIANASEEGDDIAFLPMRMSRDVRALEQTMVQGEVSVGSRVDSASNEQLVKYSENRNPEAELNEIEAVADSIRTAIEKNFSLSQILLRVGDERLESSPGIWYSSRAGESRGRDRPSGHTRRLPANLTVPPVQGLI